MIESEPLPAPRFDRVVERNGYLWWYFDALSDDGRLGFTVIAFVGSVFSPYYAAARRAGRGDPDHHCAINVALYGQGPHRWALTERGRDALHRSADRFQVGPSSLTWNGRWLEIRIHEITVPIPRPLRGTIRIHPPALDTQSYRLDPQGKHHWWPVAPDCRVEVAMDQPGLSWKGRGYFDSNRGSEPLEAGFSDWDWSRAPLPGGGCAVLYDKRLRDGSSRAMALRFDRHGEASELPLPEPTRLATTTIWRIPRETRSEAGPPARVLHTLEDTPFYARSLVEASISGARVQAFHESLLLDRFNSRWVQTLLPFRMPRTTRAFPEG